jgi:flagellar assembly factor FliW
MGNSQPALSNTHHGEGMLTVSTTRFGDISIEEDKVIHFPDGILGFPDQNAFVIQQHKPGSVFYWLQSVTLPYLAFVIINPFLGEKDYLKELPPSDQAFFEGVDEGKTLALAVVTIKPEGDPPLTMNLVGPIIIDLVTKTGKQVVLTSTRFSCKQPLVLSS